MIKKEDFFIPENESIFVSDEYYTHIELYIRFLDAFSRTTNKSLYVIDFFRRNFFYVSDNPLFLCGMSSQQVRNMGYDFYIQNVVEEELPLLLEIRRAGFSFSQSIAPANRQEYTLSCDFHMKQPSGKELLINHEVTPLHLTEDGKVWLVLCPVSLSSQTTSGNIEMFRRSHNRRWSYHTDSGKWSEHECIRLKDQEKEILRLSVQGYTMSEIAEQTHKSMNTIKGRKRLLFEKLNVSNITEAINLAAHHKLI